MNRFDYVRYDDAACITQQILKKAFEGLESVIDENVTSPRAKALIFTKLEEAYMWAGKATRDDQLTRNGSASAQEGRTNS